MLLCLIGSIVVSRCFILRCFFYIRVGYFIRILPTAANFAVQPGLKDVNGSSILFPEDLSSTSEVLLLSTLNSTMTEKPKRFQNMYSFSLQFYIKEAVKLKGTLTDLVG